MISFQKGNIMTNWNSFNTKPTEVGEYKAALDTTSVGKDIRYWWNGKDWSKAYSITWPEYLQKHAKSQVMNFNLYWQSNE
jgi:hypothetical protein